MKIIIAGAGSVGTHLAKLLILEKHEIVIIDSSAERLISVQNVSQIITFVGSATRISDLNEINIGECDLFIAVTNLESININACVLAKKLGAKNTFARIDNSEYQLPDNETLLRSIGVDSTVYPEMLAAQEIVTLVKHPWTRFFMDLSIGAIKLVGVKVRKGSSFVDKQLKDFVQTEKKMHIVAIKRNSKTIIPSGFDYIRNEDIVFFTTTEHYINDLPILADKKITEVKNIMIVGGSRVAVRACQLLPKKINVKLLEADKDKCEQLLEVLPSNVTVFHNDGKGSDFLMYEGISDMDVFIALTGSSEANIMSCMLAKNFGVPKVIAEIENMDYIQTAENLNIGSIINKKIITVDSIYRVLLNEDVSSVKTLMVANADVAEIVIKPNSYVTKQEVKDLKLPHNITIGGLIRNNEPIMVEGNTVIEPYDTVMVFCLDDTLKEAERFFAL